MIEYASLVGEYENLCRFSMTNLGGSKEQALDVQERSCNIRRHRVWDISPISGFRVSMSNYHDKCSMLYDPKYGFS